MEWQAARVADRSYPVVCIPQPCPSRPMGRLWSAAFPLSASWPTRRPSRRDHCGGSDPPEGSVYRAPPCAPVNARRCRSSGQKGGGRSLHFLPLPCGATTRRARGWTRDAGAARGFTAADLGNPCQSASNADSRAQPGPQRRGLRPLIVQICNCQNRAPLRAPPPCATPLL